LAARLSAAALQPASKPDAAFEASWRRPFKVRLLIMMTAIFGWAAVLEARLVYLQVVQHKTWVKEAKEQQEDLIDWIRGAETSAIGMASCSPSALRATGSSPIPRW
jgi:hypothetical protein